MAELKIIRKAEVPKIDFDTDFMFKKANTVIVREYYIWQLLALFCQ
jgi:hypothetical protein